MKIETTLNMHKKTLEKIDLASKLIGKSRMYVIRFLLKKYIQDHNNMTFFWKSVRYQNRENPCQWQKFHISLSECEYEYCLDLRKICKMSLSYIISEAAGKYLNKQILNLICKCYDYITDNYRFINYVVSKEIIDGVVCWKQYWGILPDLSKLFPLRC
ncbi:MAG: hypothetical protein A2176_14965 [Spirochaetes bacterium RBG_13_51_14]|nr:MAG: hypothetical protein A2176_14965 [Spirochaetes bacterium RBG_13_51_14]